MQPVKHFTSAMQDFKTFALRGNAIDLAIGVALGAAFTIVVEAVVADILTPLIAAIFGDHDFGALYFTIHHSEFHYGLVINAVITFVAVAFMLFFIVVRPLNSLRRRLNMDKDTSVPLAQCPACLTEINAAAKRCPSCTETLSEGWAIPAQ